jgi:hypothetical protein
VVWWSGDREQQILGCAKDDKKKSKRKSKGEAAWVDLRR